MNNAPAPLVWTHTPYFPAFHAPSASMRLADTITHPKRVWSPSTSHPDDYPELRKDFGVVDYTTLQQINVAPQPRDAIMVTLVLGNIPRSVAGEANVEAGETRVNTAMMRSVVTYLGIKFHSMKEDHHRGHSRSLFRVTLSPAEADKLLALNDSVLFRPDFLLIVGARASKNLLVDAVAIMRQNNATRHGLMSIERQMPRAVPVEEE
ncbi:Hypothetical protein, putative [Bodo saltans]|uniref:Uncharacterized protein n=1 Tax=Bodo saltans TaxID=75058 RepID=A0A0S4KIM8_BODSA|nr:Hypothetical protein, putative [Bodo saltans]|eukprot:CUI14363.1 Hypothetical protein, putative [Bodo saltans]